MSIPGPGTALAVVLLLHLLVVGGWLLVRRPQRGVLALAVLTPFDGLLLLLPDPGPLAGWKEALVLATLAGTLVAPQSARAAGRLRWPPFTPAVLGLLVVGAASAVWVARTGGPTQALVGLKLNAFYVLVFVALVRCPLSRLERDRLVTIIMAVGLVTALVGLWQQAVGGAVLNALGYEYNETIRTAGGLLRSFSTFNQPFPFGFYLMVVLLIGLPVALADHRRLRNRLFLVMLPVLLAGTVSSIVRAALLGFVVGAAVLWASGYRRLAHFVPPVLAAALFVPLSIYGTLLSSSSLGQRASGWSETLGRVLQAPLGNGIGSTGSAAEKTAELAGRSDAIYQPDNYYFKTAYELGPIGLWLLLLLLVSAALTARHTARALATRARLAADPAEAALLRGDGALAAGIGGAVVAAGAAMLVATYLEIFPVDLHFWLLLGVLSSLAPPPTAPSPSAPSPSDQEAAASRPTPVSSSPR